jgi:hypothetical protein
MGKSTASGNVTAEEFTTPAVVRDAIGRDHLVGPMRNREDLEKELGEVEEQGEPKIDDEKSDEKRDADADKSSTQTSTPPGAGSTTQSPKLGTSTAGKSTGGK